MVDRGSLNLVKNLTFVDPRIISQAPCDNMNLLPESFSPGNWDVICQGGKENYDHIGNRRFRICIDNNINTYMKAKNKHEKTLVVSVIVSSIRESTTQAGGGFVRKDLASKRWYEVGDKVAREKVGHALRDSMKLYLKGNGVNSIETIINNYNNENIKRKHQQQQVEPKHPEEEATDDSVERPSKKQKRTHDIKFSRKDCSLKQKRINKNSNDSISIAKSRRKQLTAMTTHRTKQKSLELVSLSDKLLNSIEEEDDDDDEIEIFTTLRHQDDDHEPSLFDSGDEMSATGDTSMEQEYQSALFGMQIAPDTMQENSKALVASSMESIVPEVKSSAATSRNNASMPPPQSPPTFISRRNGMSFSTPIPPPPMFSSSSSSSATLPTTNIDNSAYTKQLSDLLRMSAPASNSVASFSSFGVGGGASANDITAVAAPAISMEDSYQAMLDQLGCGTNDGDDFAKDKFYTGAFPTKKTKNPSSNGVVSFNNLSRGFNSAMPSSSGTTNIISRNNNNNNDMVHYI